jgi:predicted AAA+ superfamily ATPase
MILREKALERLAGAIEDSPVTLLLGPRQVGKTTLARSLAERGVAAFFDLELPSDRARLAEPELALSGLTGLVIVDEVQLQAEVLSVLRPLADRAGMPARFLLLGSAAPELMKGAAESLAGRVAFVDLGGFSVGEVGAEQQQDLWLKGGFPRSFLAPDEARSMRWRLDFVRTFLERDVPQFGLRVAAETMLRFWTMLAHYHGQTWNGAELARALGLSDKTLRHYLDVLCGGYVLRQLQPWHENLGKRQVKSPKIYFRDSGLLHALLGVETWHGLLGHPKFGASWEGFALEQILNRVPSRQAWFWATHNGAELDLLLDRNGRRIGIEFKASAAPAMTKSLHVAKQDLALAQAFIVYPGTHRYPVADGVDAIPLAAMLTWLEDELSLK